MAANGGHLRLTVNTCCLFVRLQLYFKLGDKGWWQCHRNVQLHVERICFSKPTHGLKLLSRI